MPKRGRTEAERLSSTPGSSTNRFTSTSVDTSDADSEIAPQESPPAAKPQPVETRLFASGALAEYLPKLFLIEKGAHAGYYGCRLCHPGGRCDETKRHGRGLASVFSATTISNVSTIRRHFSKYHPLGDDGIPQRKASASQATLDRYFSPGRQTSVVKDLVMMVCANDLSFNFVEEPRAHRLLAPYFPKPTFGRKDMKDAVVSLYEEVRTQLFSALSGKLVLLCIDGGTIYRKTYLNVTVACENCSYFYTSFPAQRLTSEWISEQLKTVIRELRNNGVVVAGICADNASNMQKAATLLQADPFDSSDEECDPLGAEDEEKPVQFDFTYDEANEAGHFFFNVRCWAHTLQLVLHDAQSNAHIKQGFTVCKRVCADLRSRETLAAVQSQHDTWKEIPVPTETRWNSYLRAMHRIVSQAHDLSQHVKIAPRELYAMQLTLIVCAPIAWATDVVQADSCDVAKAVTQLTLIGDRLAKLKSFAQSKPCDANSSLAAAAQAVEAALEKRKSHFDSGLVKLVRYLNPLSRTSDFDTRWIEVQLQLLLTDCHYESTRLLDEIVWYNVHGSVLPKDADAFWSSDVNKARYPALLRCVELLNGLLVTEASVERSFQSQKSIRRPRRNRLTSESTNAQLFLKWNYDRLNATEKGNDAAKRQTRSNTLHENDWLAMVDSLSETLQRATETQPHMQTRMASAKIAAAKLQTGLRIQYEVTPGVPVKAIVYEKIRPYTWRVRTIEPASDVTSEFLPITDHIGWTFVDSVDEPSE